MCMMNKAIVIAGSGRSGTTWIQDTIAKANGLQTLFEPLHPIGVPAAREFSYRYLTANAEEPDLKVFMDKVFSGKHRSLWANYRIRPDRFNFFLGSTREALSNGQKLIRNYRKYRVKGQNGLVIKFIRANLMLPWIANQYGLPILFVTRHPGAVMASRLRLGGSDWVSQQELDCYKSDPELVRVIQDTFGVDISEPFSPVAALTCVWCIENLLPVQWADDAGYMMTAYEKLVVNDEDEWGRVISGLGLSQVPHSSLRASPSQQVSNEMKEKTFSGNQLGRWRQVLTENQMSEIALMLDRFSCALYSMDRDFPM